MEQALELVGLTKVFGAERAVDELGLTVPKGSFFGVLGPNGAGKTTSLSMAVGLLRPDAGTARIFGVDVWAEPTRAKALVGVLPDGLGMPERLTGREVLTYLGLLRGLAEDEVNARTTELLEVLELDGEDDKQVAISYGLFFCLMPLAVGWKVMLPWAGPASVIMAGAMSANLYGTDGTALWATLMIPGSARPDVRARQRAFLEVFGPPTLAITLLLTWWAGDANAWPLVLSTLPALLGGAAGLAVASSVYAAVPTTDAHKRSGNPLNSGENEGETMGIVYVMLVLVSVTAGPALAAALAWSWWGVPIGVLSGVLAWWYLGRLAAARLERRGPELLTLLRHGRSTTEQAKRTAALDSLPRWRRTAAGFCLGFGAIPLFPQAVVPAILKLTGNDDTKSWFLALYLDPPWQWVVIAAMAALGLAMYAYGGLTYLRAKPAPDGPAVADAA